MVHSFLLIGQSNMAGRGFYTDVEKLDNPRLKMMRNGKWLNMFWPVNPDRSFAGVNLAESFADAYSKDHDVDVGLIPCADGGTRLEEWVEGSILFDNAVNNAKLAQRTSQLAGILWHQGEGDCTPDRYVDYAERFMRMADALRRQLNMPNLPILVGGLGDFLVNLVTSPDMKNYVFVNEQLEKIGREYPNCGFVSAVGLGSNPDNLHFNAKALREFGLRYYEVYKTLDVEIKEEGGKEEIASSWMSAL